MLSNNVLLNGTLQGNPAPTGFTVTGLAPNTTYSMTVTALDAAGNSSAASTAKSVTTAIVDTQSPTTPTNLAATNITSSSFTLNWTASTDNVGVTSYDVYKNGAYLATSAANTCSVTGLAPSTSYTMSVKAKDAAGNASAASTGLLVTTTSGVDTTPPAAPIGLTLTQLLTNTLSLTWTPATDNVGVTSYDIYNGSSVIGNTTTTSFTYGSLTASTTYNLSIKAKDAAGNVSPASASLMATTDSTALPNTGMKLWLRSDVGLPASGSVATWLDNSGSGNSASQPNSTQQPLVVANAANGKSVVRFDGATGLLNLPAMLSGATAGEI